MLGDALGWAESFLWASFYDLMRKDRSEDGFVRVIVFNVC